jgi:mono/diheme cytochrome c family protein
MDCRYRIVCFLIALAAAGRSSVFAAGPEHAVVPGYERVFAGEEVDAVTAGRILLTELSCVSCHATDASLASELKSKRGPILSQVGTRARPEWLAEFLTSPHTTKAGTTMPDLLAGSPDADRKHNALALAHFLTRSGKPADALGDTAAARRGEQLFHQIGCVACHNSQQADAVILPTSVPLGGLDRKYTIPSLAAFLKNPLAVRPGGRMPSFNLNDQQARDLACFFLRDIKVPTNLKYAYYEGSWQNLPDFSQLKPKTTGMSSGFDVGVRERNDQFGLVFSGFLQVPTDGNYRFFLGSDDGSRLLIDGKEVVRVDGVHPHTVKEGRHVLKQGARAVVVEYFEGGGEESLGVEFEGPGFARQPLASIATPTKEPPKAEEGDLVFTLDDDLAELGQRLFSTRGCASCHEMAVDGKAVRSASRAKKLAELTNMTGGCLAKETVAGVPRYQLSERQRKHLASAIQSLQEPGAPVDVSPEARIHQSFVRFNCYGCHKRRKVGGPEEERDAFFLSTMKEMGDEGRLPPPLDGVGDKLTEAYLKGILDNGVEDRPYMLTAMPKFGGASVGHLLADFRAADLKTEAELADIVLPVTKMKSIGRRLSGEKGLGCIKCHTFGKHKATGIQSIDLQKMTQRLRKDWFHRYMASPQDFRPGTRMPAPWPFGQATIRDVLEGNVGQQMQASWLYLADGAKAGIPAGLTQGAIILTPTDEPIVYRNFIEGVSARGIAVGYPEQANLCFDADQMCLALIWENGFIDAAKHWVGRGPGFQRPHGDNVLSLVRGVPFATLEDMDASWPATAPAELGYRFRGYRFNAKRQPIFLYSVGDVSISDEIVPQTNERGLTEFQRTLSLKSDGAAGVMLYRAAAGNSIEAKDGWFVVDEHLQVQIKATNAAPVLRKLGGKAELLLRFDLTNGPIEILQRYAW